MQACLGLTSRKNGWDLVLHTNLCGGEGHTCFSGTQAAASLRKLQEDTQVEGVDESVKRSNGHEKEEDADELNSHRKGVLSHGMGGEEE